MNERQERPSKQKSIDKRFALVDAAGELRFPYKKTQRSTGKHGFAVGHDRHGAATYFENLEDVIHAVVFEGRRVRVTVDPPTEGKGSNGLSLHAMREVQGYVLSKELSHLVVGAPFAPLGTPTTYPRPSTQPSATFLGVWGVVSAADLARAVVNQDGEFTLVRTTSWRTMSAMLDSRPQDLAPIPFLLTQEDTGAAWVADIATIRSNPGPSSVVELRGLTRLLEPIPSESIANFHTGKPLQGASRTDMPCVMLPELAAMVTRSRFAHAFRDEALHPDARQFENDSAADPGISVTVRRALANARVGQGGYRVRMLNLWGNQCAVTGCSIARVLVASHAKPWAESTDSERLDEYNGLLLSASLDKLFDGGLVAFDEQGRLLTATLLSDADLASVGLSRSSHLRRVAPRHQSYLKAHRMKHGFDAD